MKEYTSEYIKDLFAEEDNIPFNSKIWNSRKRTPEEYLSMIKNDLEILDILFMQNSYPIPKKFMEYNEVNDYVIRYLPMQEVLQFYELKDGYPDQIINIDKKGKLFNVSYKESNIYISIKGWTDFIYGNLYIDYHNMLHNWIKDILLEGKDL